MMVLFFMRKRSFEVGFDDLCDKIFRYLGHSDRFKVDHLALPWDIIILFVKPIKPTDPFVYNLQ